MSIIFKSQSGQLTASGYSGNLTYEEGYVKLPLPIITIDASYASTITVTFTVDEAIKAEAILKSNPVSSSNNIILDRVDNVYTLVGDSLPLLDEHLETLYLETHDDLAYDFKIDVSISDGGTPLTGVFDYTADDIVDNEVTESVRTKAHNEKEYVGINVTVAGDPDDVVKDLRIADQYGTNTGKTYEVVVTAEPDIIEEFIVDDTPSYSCGKGYLYKSTNMIDYDLLQTFYPDDYADSKSRFAERVESTFTTMPNPLEGAELSFYDTIIADAGSIFEMVSNSCQPNAWTKTGTLEPSTIIRTTTGSYTGEDFSVTVTGDYENDVVYIDDSEVTGTIEIRGYDTDAGDNFGSAVHLSENGQMLFVAAPYDTEYRKGTIYVFKRTTSSVTGITLPEDSCGVTLSGTSSNSGIRWKQIQSWNAPELIDDTLFALNFKVLDKPGNEDCCVDPIMGEYVFIQAHETDRTGTIYVYNTVDEANWTLIQTLKAPVVTVGGQYGRDLKVTAFRDENTKEILEMYLVTGERNGDLDAAGVVGNDGTLTITGSQYAVNRILDNVTYKVEFGYSEYDLVFTQNVTAGNDFVPYLQEQIKTTTDVEIAFNPVPNPKYDEDVISTVLLATPSEKFEWYGTDVFEVTLSAPNGENVSPTFFTGDLSTIGNIETTLTPGADAVDPVTILMDVVNTTSGEVYPQVPYEVTVAATHDEFVLYGPFTYNEDEILTGMNIGAITDVRGDTFPDTQYQVDLSTTNGTFNLNTLVGTKAEVNALLSNMTFTPSASAKTNFTVTYIQQQLTDGVAQGSGTFNMNIGDIHQEFVMAISEATYNEDETASVTNIAQVTDLRPDNIDPTIQYSISLTPSDLSAGAFTPSLITGTKAEVNALLATGVTFTPSADYKTDFEVIYSQTQTTNSIDQGSATFNMKIGTTDVDNGYTVNTGPYSWTQNSNTGLNNFATITDGAGDLHNATYRALVILDAPASDANGVFVTFGSGGTSVWDDIDTLTIEGTKTEVQSHLDSLEWWSRGPTDAFTFSSSLSRRIDSGAFAELRNVTGITANTGMALPSPANTNINRLYDEDIKTNFGDESKTS